MKNKIFFCQLCMILFCTIAHAKIWHASIENNKIHKDLKSNSISVIHFKKNTNYQFTYKPPQLPFGAVDIKNLVHENHEFILSIWSHGAKTIMLRVFEPSVSKYPVCELISEGDDVKTRYKNNNLEVLISNEGPSGDIIEEWTICKGK